MKLFLILGTVFLVGCATKPHWLDPCPEGQTLTEYKDERGSITQVCSFPRREHGAHNPGAKLWCQQHPEHVHRPECNQYIEMIKP